ncbi:MAG: hypothetical protein ABSE51_15140 [Terracidiphilus sp.]
MKVAAIAATFKRMPSTISHELRLCSAYMWICSRIKDMNKVFDLQPTTHARAAFIRSAFTPNSGCRIEKSQRALSNGQFTKENLRPCIRKEDKLVVKCYLFLS